jgi:hypothetical protein
MNDKLNFMILKFNKLRRLTVNKMIRGTRHSARATATPPEITPVNQESTSNPTKSFQAQITHLH